MWGDITTSLVPAERDGAFHMAPHGEKRPFEWHPQIEFPRGNAPATADETPRTGNHPYNGVIRRANDGTIVVQEAVSDSCQPRLRFVIVRNHRFAADISGSRDQWRVEFRK